MPQSTCENHGCVVVYETAWGKTASCPVCELDDKIKELEAKNADEWSHTPEAYGNAEQNIRNRSRKWLLTVLREWAHWDLEADGAENPGFRLPFNHRIFSKDSLADMVWDLMRSQATCANGGFDAWACPYGCCTVSFDLERKDDEDD